MPIEANRRHCGRGRGIARHIRNLRIHKALRVTPAMQGGISDKLWEVADIVALVEMAEAKPAKRGPYRKAIA